MGLFDKVKDFISDDDDDFDEYYDDSSTFESSRKSNRDRQSSASSYDRYERDERTDRADKGSRRQKSDKVVNIHTTAQLQVVLLKPERYEDAVMIADHLGEKRTVVLNLESTNRDTARRLLDFLTGVAYANNGNLKRVANSTYIITPYNVDVMGDLIDELENNGMFI